MDMIVVKIERSYISLEHQKEDGGIQRLMSLRRAMIPDDMPAETFVKKPEFLAETIVTGIRNSGMKTKNLAIYLGSGLERFSEYRFNSALNDAEKKKREKQEEQKLMSGPKARLYRLFHYRYAGKGGELSSSAAFAVDADFCDRLISALEKEGYTVKELSSSVVCFAELAALVSDIGEKVFVISAEKKEYKAALFIDGKLTRLIAEEGGTDSWVSANSLLHFIDRDTKVVLCGFESQNSLLREFLKNGGAAAVGKAGAAAVGSVNQKMKGPKARFSLSGELAYHGETFPGLFSSAALPAKASALSYLPKSKKQRNPYAWVYAVCIVFLLVALFICTLPLMTMTIASREHEENKARLEEPFFSDAAEILSSYKNLVAEKTDFLEAEKSVPGRDLSYAVIIDELLKGLLADAVIEEMYYESGNGLFLDFLIFDEEAFDKGKNLANESGLMNMYEPFERIEVDEGIWRIQLRVSRIHTPEGAS